MVSERIRALRKRLQERREQASDLKSRAATSKQRAVDRVERRVIPVEAEARATKEELSRLRRTVGEPVTGIAKRAASGAEGIRESARQLEGSLDEVQDIERDTLAAFEGEGFELVEGRRQRADADSVRDLRQRGVEKGVQAGNTAFTNRIKRRVRKRRLESLLRSEPDEPGMAGADFGVDLEIVDDLRRGEDPPPEADQGLDVLFEDAGEVPELLDDNVAAEFEALRGDG